MLNQEIQNGVKDGILKRLSSPFYGYFLISWSLVNWKLLYVTFFVSNSSIIDSHNKLKSDYVNELFFSNWKYVIFLDFIAPLLLVVFFVWIAPLFTNVVFKKDKKNELELENISRELETEKSKTEELLLKQKVQTEKVKEDIESKNPKLLWEEEYKKLKETKHFKEDFWIIKDLVLVWGGEMSRLHDILGSKDAVKIITEYIFLLATKDLLAEERGGIELTEKGNYIMGRYIEDAQGGVSKRHGFKAGLN